MTTDQPRHTGEPHQQPDTQPAQPAQQPTPTVTTAREPQGLELSDAFKARLEQHYLPPGVTVDQLAARAAVVRAGHKGRHRFGHPSGRVDWRACAEWRPMPGVRCPVCPDVCPCGAHYVNPFPVDPRDG